jgi:hypothetical protein
MGTRALISIDGKPFIATHWDGYYGGLGKDLLKAKAKTPRDIVAVAADGHSIDFADMSNEAIKEYAENRIKTLMEKHNLSRDDILKGKRRGGVVTSDDYEVSPISNYGDFAEYQYDYDTDAKVWRIRQVSGAWDSNPATGDWWEMPIGDDDIEAFEEGRKKVWETKKRMDRDNK